MLESRKKQWVNYSTRSTPLLKSSPRRPKTRNRRWKFPQKPDMKPIRVIARGRVKGSFRSVSASIEDLSQWPSFTGFGPLPGVRQAIYETKTEDRIGSVIRVTNTDGSRHRETIRAWDASGGVTLELDAFTPPLSWLATRFVERWTFEPEGEQCVIARTLDIHPRSALTRPLLRPIAALLRRALERHLQSLGN